MRVNRLDLILGEGFENVDFGRRRRRPFQRLGAHEDVSLEIAFHKRRDLGAGVRRDLVETVDANIESAAVNQVAEKGGVLGGAMQFGLDRFQHSAHAFFRGQIHHHALGAFHQPTQEHRLADARFAFEDDLATNGGDRFAQRLLAPRSFLLHRRVGEIRPLVEGIQGGVGDKRRLERRE